MGVGWFDVAFLIKDIGANKENEMPDSEKLSKSGRYPIAVHENIVFHVPSHKLRAKPTGEFRPPKKGEWFLSGSVIEAYQASCDHETAYYIAKLVRLITLHEVDVTS
jgi:hypothetical protein